jgi:NADPH:quinone reductase-like Zn-dependent oxidoreductase
VRGLLFGVQPNGAQLPEIASLLDAGQVKPIINTVQPPAEARRAHEMIENHHTRGKIVLQVVE